jgi:hypothetical protein
MASLVFFNYNKSKKRERFLRHPVWFNVILTLNKKISRKINLHFYSICECASSDANDGNVSRALAKEYFSMGNWCLVMLRHWIVLRMLSNVLSSKLYLLFNFYFKTTTKEWRGINVILKPFSLRRRLSIHHEFSF